MAVSALILRELPSIALEKPFSFARHTTIGCGGEARLSAMPKDESELVTLLQVCKGYGIPYLFLGVGANVLPMDEFYAGVVVRFCRMKELKKMGDFIYADAGVTAGALCRFARDEGLGGLEFLTGIPASVGGAVAMNAGVNGRHISDCVSEVVGITRDFRIKTFSPEECNFSEKRSAFLDGIAVTGAVFRLEKRAPREIEARTAYYATRRAHLPKGRSMGCVFVNPEGKSAGALIDGCGLKGLSVGGAYVSPRHANFIINSGATAGEIATLIDLVKEKVFERTGILLREEIRRLPPST